MSSDPLTFPSAPPECWRTRWRGVLDALQIVVHTQYLEAELMGPLDHPAVPKVVAFVNAHAMNSVVTDPDFAEELVKADILLRDGAGMSILMRLLGEDPGVNLNGTDVIPMLLARYAGRSVALYGTVEPYLSRAAAHVQAHLAPKSSVSLAHGFADPQDYVRQAQADRPELIILGMGMPKQEQLASLLRQQLKHPCVIVCGGAIIDFMGGRFRRAPRLMRRLGLEWLHRLVHEPRRLFKRYVLGNPAFLVRSLLFKLQ